MNGKRFVLILVHLDKDGIDIVGNKFPKSGFVKSKNFIRNKDIEYGLYGVIWGNTNSFPYDKIDRGHWAVVKVEDNDNFISIEGMKNRVKFQDGIVMYFGSLKTCAKFIINNKNDFVQGFKKEALYIPDSEIAGSKEWFKYMKEKGLLCLT
jgi:hypothetical protein